MSNEIPLRHDSVTIACPVCHSDFLVSGRKTYCSERCRASAYRARRDSTQPKVPVVGKKQPLKPITVYECDICGERALGEQRCDECQKFMRRVGFGGLCPHCDGAVAYDELTVG
ncbi:MULTISPECIES: hypothetical protein [Acidithrix]|uniref:Uncharacterized protein n=1 Tax=Acidithrix ferrooxidans TaxID=1280514 RepID=A0A0D8HLZ1_9ACTN|nr:MULTISPECIES: hypothetical protein [Acidithrix]KJF18782.1 hypothetical protein AXFE_03200 [Acidithrix ferrooxidans]